MLMLCLAACAQSDLVGLWRGDADCYHEGGDYDGQLSLSLWAADERALSGEAALLIESNDGARVYSADVTVPDSASSDHVYGDCVSWQVGSVPGGACPFLSDGAVVSDTWSVAGSVLTWRRTEGESETGKCAGTLSRVYPP